MIRRIALLRFFFSAIFFLLLSTFSFSQNSFRVNGIIRDAGGQPVEGATVQEKGTSNTTQTKNDGSFQLNVASGNAVLVISSIGFESKELPVNNTTQINTSLATSAGALEDIVVIGYGTQKRRNVTSAVSNFDARALSERPVGRVDQALVGQMAGVTVKQTTGALGKGMSVQ
ncbi:MAG: TonB-dependent receptor, partial [Chitinophagaceae bacterium]